MNIGWLRFGMRLLLLLGSSSLVAETLSGRVIGISDGDTISLLDTRKGLTKIRLHQIDAPEKKQDFGQRSKQSLSELIYGKQVRIDVADIDKYGRTVGTIWLGQTDINMEQVKRGMAWVYVKYATDPGYFAAESTAKNARFGLWSQPNAIPPWMFRHPERANATAPTPSSAMQKSTANKCGTKRFCKEMTDCAEANYFLNVCGVRQLDGDGDERPCEALCQTR